ncbi:hypothetical protein [Pedobacter sp.]|uniref:hypothetical protein n=1 Tax=Pedobacter sp. TaxID=1411316 RepID=UPI0031CFF8A7
MKKSLLVLIIIASLSCKKKKEQLESGIIKSYVGTMLVTHIGNINQGKSIIWDAKEFDKDDKVIKHIYSFENNWIAQNPVRISTDEVDFVYKNGVLSSKRTKLYAATVNYTIVNGDTLIIDNVTDYKSDYTYETRKHQNGKIVESSLRRFAGIRETKFFYDNRGFPSHATGMSGYEPLEFRIEYEYDNKGRLLKEIEISKWGAVVQRAFSYTDDLQGKLVSLKYYVYQAGWRKHNYVYNRFGHKAKVEVFASNTENGTYVPYGEINYSYVYW